MCCYRAVFSEVAKLHKLAFKTLISQGGGSYSVSWCVRPLIKLMPGYSFKQTTLSVKRLAISMKLLQIFLMPLTRLDSH